VSKLCKAMQQEVVNTKSKFTAPINNAIYGHVQNRLKIQATKINQTIGNITKNYNTHEIIQITSKLLQHIIIKQNVT
jgi:hypothetical protein